MNGVTRGGVYSSFADRSMCSYRGYWGNTLDSVSVGRGFRLNGVVRCGEYIYNQYRSVRCSRRTYLGKTWSSPAVSVGFRSV